MSDDQLRAKSLAVFHALVSTWSNDLRKEVSGLQDELLKRLDALQDQMSNYDENIDEERILTFVREVSNLAGGGGGGGGDGGGSSLKILRQSLRKIDDGTSLTEVLTLLLEELSQFAPRVALFILKGGSCIGWNGRGFNDSPGFNDEGIKRISVPTTADTVFSDVIKSRSSFVGESNKHPDNIQLLSRVGNVLPLSMLLFFTLNREDFSFVIHLDRQPRTSRRREAQTGSRARSGSRSERTLDAVEHSRTLMEWWPFLIFHRGGLRIKVINNTCLLRPSSCTIVSLRSSMPIAVMVRIHCRRRRRSRSSPLIPRNFSML